MGWCTTKKCCARPHWSNLWYNPDQNNGHGWRKWQGSSQIYIHRFISIQQLNIKIPLHGTMSKWIPAMQKPRLVIQTPSNELKWTSSTDSNRKKGKQGRCLIQTLTVNTNRIPLTGIQQSFNDLQSENKGFSKWTPTLKHQWRGILVSALKRWNTLQARVISKPVTYPFILTSW